MIIRSLQHTNLKQTIEKFQDNILTLEFLEGAAL